MNDIDKSPRILVAVVIVTGYLSDCHGDGVAMAATDNPAYYYTGLSPHNSMSPGSTGHVGQSRSGVITLGLQSNNTWCSANVVTMFYQRCRH